ncbi:MAG: agmatine deiminase family protein [Acidobacteria bacterium]|nr:agmatine deiminase family protein [Acidobacteriota bacterium]
MKRKIFYGLLLAFIGLPALLVLAQAPLPEDEIVLPRYRTQAEKDYEQAMTTAGPGGGYIWECWPDLAGITGQPPATARWRGESGKLSGVIYGWPSYGCQMPELTELIRNSIANVTVTVIVPSGLYNSARTCLRNRGITDAQLDTINWFFAPLDGIWIRDWGPEVLLDDKDGSYKFVDMVYYDGFSTNCRPPLPGRPNDNVAPTLLASEFVDGPAEVLRPPLRTEGGYIMVGESTAGEKTCIRQTRDIFSRNNFTRAGHETWQYTQDAIDDVFRQYYNCPNVVRMTSQQRDPWGFGVIDHMDMTTAQISANKFLVGRFDPDDDPVNALIIDSHAEALEAAGLTVVRIPMPKPYCTVRRASCISLVGDVRECTTPPTGLDRVFATYANSIRVGNKMMVPVYRDLATLPQDHQDTIAAQEAEALAIFQRELDAEFGTGSVEVVPVVSDRMIPCQGAVHCITMTY